MKNSNIRQITYTEFVLLYPSAGITLRYTGEHLPIETQIERWYNTMDPKMNFREHAKRNLGIWFGNEFDKHMLTILTGENNGRK